MSNGTVPENTRKPEEVAGIAPGRAQDGAVVSVYEDGPLIVRGEFTIRAQDGQLIPSGRRTVALCRCGQSAIKPFCDGSHARTGFRAPGNAQRLRAAAEDCDGSRGARHSLTSQGATTPTTPTLNGGYSLGE
jgi:CDGSH-type Zn-finger protein